MPEYEYERADKTRFSVRQSIKAPPLAECPETGQPVVRVIAAAPAVLKGGGWASDGYSRTGR